MMYFGLFIAGTFFGVVILSIFRSGSIADEMALIDEIDRLKRALRETDRCSENDRAALVGHAARCRRIAAMETPNAAHAAKRMAAVARGDA